MLAASGPNGLPDLLKLMTSCASDAVNLLRRADDDTLRCVGRLAALGAFQVIRSYEQQRLEEAGHE